MLCIVYINTCFICSSTFETGLCSHATGTKTLSSASFRNPIYIYRLHIENWSSTSRNLLNSVLTICTHGNQMNYPATYMNLYVRIT